MNSFRHATRATSPVGGGFELHCQRKQSFHQLRWSPSLCTRQAWLGRSLAGWNDAL